MTLKVLAVIPTVAGLPTLGWADELLQMVETPGVELTPLPGEISKKRLGAWLQGDQWGVLVWIGHAVPGQLLLANGETVEARWLASQMRGHVGLALLSACESDVRPESAHGLVTGFIDEIPPAGVALVAMAFAVADRSALRFDVALVEALAAGEPAWRAHQVALEAVAHNPMVQAPRFYEGVRMASDFRSYGQQPDQRLIYDLMARMGVVETRMGSVAEDVTEMRSEMREMRNDIKALAPSRAPLALPRELVALMSVGALITAVLLMIIAWRLV